MRRAIAKQSPARTLDTVADGTTSHEGRALPGPRAVPICERRSRSQIPSCPVNASIWLYFLPLYILGGLLLVLGIFALLGRIAGGRYLKPIVTFLMKLPLVGRLMRKASEAALERQNPELASAVKKMERAGVARDPQRAAQALSRLSREERAAYLDATSDQSEAMPMNRQMKRQLERARKGRRR